MRLALGSAALLVLAACDVASGPAAPDGPIRSEESAKDQAATAAPAETGEAAEPSAELRFVGGWAANEGACESATWRFSDTMLTTPAGSTCSFNKVTEVEGGYDIEATCTAEAPPTSDILKLRLAGDGSSMAFQSKSVADANLLSCGDSG